MSKNNTSVIMIVILVIQKSQGDLGLSVGLVDDDLFTWRLCFQGPEGTPYEGGWYSAILKFPDDFPISPPVMTFKTEMFHPNSTFNFKI